MQLQLSLKVSIINSRNDLLMQQDIPIDHPPARAWLFFKQLLDAAPLSARANITFDKLRLPCV